MGTTIDILIVKLPHAVEGLPGYSTKGAAAFDIRAANDSDIVIHPGKSALVPTGLSVAIPEGYELQIRPRSGLALKEQVTVLNTPGTIDSDYRGEVGVILINHSDRTFYVERGDRIAQGVVTRFALANFIEVKELPPTERQAGGFGSTGKKG